MACATPRAGTSALVVGAMKLLAAVLLAVVAVALAAPGKADAQELLPATGGHGGAAASDGGGGTVTVESGDTLSGIAEEVFGDAGRWVELLEANRERIDDPDLIFPEQVLIVAGEEAAPTTPAAAPAPAPEPTQNEGDAAATEEAVDTAQEEEAYASQYERPASPGPQEEEEAAPAPADVDAAPSGSAMSLTIPALGISGVPVVDEDSEAALTAGAMHLPGTGFPWQEGSNTYIAGHRVGSPGTPSDRVFYDLPSLRQGDEVVLTDADGRDHAYAVTEMFAVSPSDTWVTGPVAGRDVVTLQTCTETVDDWTTIGPRLMSSGPESGRLIVRADRVS